MLRRLVKTKRELALSPNTHRHKRHCHACTCCYACLEKSEHSGEHDLSWSFGGCALGCLMFQSQPRQKNKLTAQSSKTHQGPASLPRARRHDNACEHTYADHCACHPRLLLSHAHTDPQNHHTARQTNELLRLRNHGIAKNTPQTWKHNCADTATETRIYTTTHAKQSDDYEALHCPEHTCAAFCN